MEKVFKILSTWHDLYFTDRSHISCHFSLAVLCNFLCSTNEKSRIWFIQSRGREEENGGRREEMSFQKREVRFKKKKKQRHQIRLLAKLLDQLIAVALKIMLLILKVSAGMKCNDRQISHWRVYSLYCLYYELTERPSLTVRGAFTFLRLS